MSSHTCNTTLTKGVLALVGARSGDIARRTGYSASRFTEIVGGHRTASDRFRTLFFQALQDELSEALFPVNVPEAGPK